MKALGAVAAIIVFLNPGIAVPVYAQWSEPQIVPGINTAMIDYFPCITQDGRKMYFTSYRSNNEDIYVSERINGSWTAPVNLGSPINSVHRDLAPAISPDGRTLYFTSYNREGGYGSYDIWYSQWQDSSQSWGELINPGPNINSPATEWSPSFSHDGSKLYFSSGYSFRPGHVGGLDLYVSEWNGEEWGPPVNLGEEVNTYGTDYCPSIASDDTTLYFASHHHHYLPCWHGPAIDIFVAYYTGGVWTNVVNICDPINTDAWERSPFISFNDDTLYFASRREGADDDIYFSVKEPTAVKNNDKLRNNKINNINVSPNPFNSYINIVYSTSSLGSQPPEVKLVLYDILGREVRTLVDERKAAGTYRVTWDGLDDLGHAVSSGIYIARLSQRSCASGDFPVKITLLR